MSIKHFSAGGIVVKAIDGKPHVLLTQHSKHKGWGFPKGHIEKGEKPEDAAVREVEEETGIKGGVRGRAGDVQYFFVQNGSRIDKTVTFFLMDYLDEGHATTAWEVMDQEWVPVGEVERHLTFDSERELWQKIREKISMHALYTGYQ